MNILLLHRSGEQIGWFMESKDYQELNGIDGEPFELERTIFPGHTTLDLFHEIRRKMAKSGIKPEKFFKSKHFHVDVQ